MKIVAWLKNDAEKNQVWLYVVLFAIINFCFMLFTCLIANWLGLNIRPKEYSIHFINWLTQHWLKFIIIVVASCIGEELIFRVAPLVVGLKIVRKRQRYGILVALCIFFTLFFGVLHAHHSYINIIIQGFTGLTLCILFLKAGGCQGKYARAFLAIVVCHLLGNLFILGDGYFYVQLASKVLQ